MRERSEITEHEDELTKLRASTEADRRLLEDTIRALEVTSRLQPLTLHKIWKISEQLMKGTGGTQKRTLKL